jgi:hypothetical protein
MEAADAALRRDMQTLDRAEELLLEAQAVARQIEERVRRAMGTNPEDRRLRLS